MMGRRGGGEEEKAPEYARNVSYGPRLVGYTIRTYQLDCPELPSSAPPIETIRPDPTITKTRPRGPPGVLIIVLQIHGNRGPFAAIVLQLHGDFFQQHMETCRGPAERRTREATGLHFFGDLIDGAWRDGVWEGRFVRTTF